MTYVAPTGNITTGVDFFSYINSVVGNMFMSGIIIAVFFIIFIKLLFSSDDSSARAFGAASFVCMILTIFLRTINLVSTTFMTIFIILTSISLIWIHVENSGRFG